MSKPSKLFGSDVYESYTAVYTFESNQMAHAMMGFAGTALITAAAYQAWGMIWPGLSFFVIPVLKDWSDYAVDIARAEEIARQGGEAAFPLTQMRRRELKQDGMTDTFFWSTGMLLALLVAFLLTEPALAWIAGVTAAMAVIVLYGILVLGKRYVREKRAFDRSGLPYLFRLPNFAGTFKPATQPQALPAIRSFLGDAAEPPAGHLVIAGPVGSGKTTLAVGIGCGLTVNRQPPPGWRNVLQVFRWIFVPAESEALPKVRYLSLVALLEAMSSETGARKNSKSGLWSLHDAEILVIDDVFATAAELLPASLHALRDKRCVWVLSDREGANSWREQIEMRQPEAAGRVHVVELEEQLAVEKPEFGLGSRPGLLSAAALLVPAVLGIVSLGILFRVADWFD